MCVSLEGLHNSKPCESAGVKILRVMTISEQMCARNAVPCMWDDDSRAVPNPNPWFPEVSVIPSDPLMFENLCSGKLIVFGGLSGGLIEDYLEERGA